MNDNKIHARCDYRGLVQQRFWKQKILQENFDIVVIGM